ncbi:MAG: hypothetical protein Q7S10_01965 [bacterium]|nr:hypothetical protein [bacterium]
MLSDDRFEEIDDKVADYFREKSEQVHAQGKTGSFGRFKTFSALEVLMDIHQNDQSFLEMAQAINIKPDEIQEWAKVAMEEYEHSYPFPF